MKLTLEQWVTVYTANGDAQHVCAWRKRVWRAMRPVVEKFLADREAGAPLSVGELLSAVEDARAAARIPAHGKRWRQEHDKLVDVLQAQRELWPAPSVDEAAACSVAHDLAELGRTDEATKLLAAQAPNHLGRPCPACGAKVSRPCVEIGFQLGGKPMSTTPRAVPHEARHVA